MLMCSFLQNSRFRSRFGDLKTKYSIILISHKNNSGLNNFKIAIAISKKVSKKAVVRNKIRRLLQDYLLKNFSKDKNHKPYWLLVNLKSGVAYNNEFKILEEFQHLIFKSGLFK